MPTFTIRGQKIRTQSQRRYIVVDTRLPLTTVKRTDNLVTARKERARNGVNRCIVDTATGEVLDT